MQLVELRLTKLDAGTLRGTDAELEQLAESIKTVDLLQPIIVNSKYEVIAGRRRLHALKKLGRPLARCVVCENLDDQRRALLAERDENTCRVKYTPAQIGELAERLRAIEEPKAEARMKAGKAAENEPYANLAEGSGRTVDKVADAVGVSPETLRKIEEVREAAKADPEKFGDLAAALEEPRSVDRVYKELKKRKAKTTKAEPIYDAKGHEVPSHLRDKFATEFLSQLVGPFEDFARDVIPKSRRHTKNTGPKFKHFRAGEALQLLDEIEEAVKRYFALGIEARPHVLCPECKDGGYKGCEYCNQAGYLTKSLAAERAKGGRGK